MKKDRFKIFFLLILILSCLITAPVFAADDSEDLPPLPKGPLLLTSTTWEQLSADYWVSRLKNPDELLLTPKDLNSFNAQIRKMDKDSVDIFKMDMTMSGVSLSKLLEAEFNMLRGRKLFGVDNKYFQKSFFDENVKPVAAWQNVPKKVKMKWGVAVRSASIRAIPTDVKMLEELGDIEFDQLQFTKIKLWTPVGIYYTSPDKKWLYLQAPYSRGWAKSSDVAIFNSRDEMKKYVHSDSFLSVTGESVRIFSNPELTKLRFKASMGTDLPLASSTQSGRTVWYPERLSNGTVSIQKAYLSKSADVTPGYLPYTQKNVIKQAFKLLGARYGWGGTYEGRDCSGFIQDVFLSMGVDMPRNSKPQGFIGTQVDHFEPFNNEAEKMNALDLATPGVTLLRMPMHMMLYLGQVDGQYFVIHSTWAERISMTSDEKNRINQVVVSDLNLNGQSRIGSLFDRIISVNEMR